MIHNSNKGCSIIMYNVPEQETNDIEDRNTQEIQSIDDFITKRIKIGSLNIKLVNRMGRYIKEDKSKTMADASYIYREEFLIANIQKYIKP